MSGSTGGGRAPEDLEKQYSPSRWVQRGITADEAVQLHCRNLETGSNKAREILTSQVLSYGPTQEQVTEWFTPPAVSKDLSNVGPVFIYIHGGYWQLLNVASSSFMAPAMANHGISTVAIGYDLCPSVSMETLVAQVETAVVSVLAKLPSSSRVFLCGHSAGAHLAAFLMTHLRPDPRIKALVLVSGVFDLEPITHTSVNDPLHMDAASSRSLSPLHAEGLASGWPTTRVLVAYGEHDSPAFEEQSLRFANRLRQEPHLRVQVRKELGDDHFSVIECLANEEHPLTKLVLGLMEADV